MVLPALLCVACNNSQKASAVDVQEEDTVTYKINGNIIEIKSNDSISHRVDIISNDASAGLSESYSFIGKEAYLDVDSVIRCSSQREELAYNFTRNTKLPLTVTIDNKTEVDFEYNYSPKPKEEGLYARLASGKAGLLVKEGSIAPKIEDIRKWLYDTGNFLEDSDIELMYDIYKDLLYRKTNNYRMEDFSSIPTIKDFSGIRYRINTNMVADYYYLFATDDDNDLESFIRDVVSDNFAGASPTSGAAFSCYRSKGKGGLLTMFLIGIDKKWNRQILPVGVVCIDNRPPIILTRNESYHETNSTGRYADALLGNNRIANNRAGLETPGKSVGSKLFADKYNDFKSLGFSITGVPNVDITENITVTGNEFRGNVAGFTIAFEKGVKSVTFAYKDAKHKVNLVNKKSPYTFNCYLPLNLGDNYIEITAEDKLGNSNERSEDVNDKSNSLYRATFYVNMVRTEDESSDININVNNNVDVTVW